MKKLRLLKATRETTFFKPGQKLWVYFGTGALAAYVVTRFKKKGRWLACWCHYADSGDGKWFTRPDSKWVGEVEVSDSFADHIERIGRHY